VCQSQCITAETYHLQINKKYLGVVTFNKCRMRKVHMERTIAKALGTYMRVYSQLKNESFNIKFIFSCTVSVLIGSGTSLRND